MLHIELEDGLTQVNTRPYSIPCVHLDTFKKEPDHLVKLGVPYRQDNGLWASPSFIIPKKNWMVKWSTDLWELNKVIKKRQYLLSIIHDVLRKRI